MKGKLLLENGQLGDLRAEFEYIKNKMADQNKCQNHMASVVLPDVRAVQFLSDSYDTIVQSKTTMDEHFGIFALRLDLLASNIDEISKAVVEMLHYSYQYNLKIVGVPQVKEDELAQDTPKLCLKLIYLKYIANLMILPRCF